MSQSCRHHIRKWIATEIILGVLFLVCGCAIYLLFRSKSLNIYKWCSAIGLSNAIDTLRSSCHNWNVPYWVKFSLPDGLYSAAYILIINAIWYKNNGLVKYIIVSVVPLLTISSEILQFFGLVKGTFDFYDIVCYAIPPLLYIVIKI